MLPIKKAFTLNEATKGGSRDTSNISYDCTNDTTNPTTSAGRTRSIDVYIYGVCNVAVVGVAGMALGVCVSFENNKKSSKNRNKK